MSKVGGRLVLNFCHSSSICSVVQLHGRGVGLLHQGLTIIGGGSKGYHWLCLVTLMMWQMIGSAIAGLKINAEKDEKNALK